MPYKPISYPSVKMEGNITYLGFNYKDRNLFSQSYFANTNHTIVSTWREFPPSVFFLLDEEIREAVVAIWKIKVKPISFQQRVINFIKNLL